MDTKKVDVKLGSISKIAREFGVSLPTVKSALNFRRKTQLARDIRLMAIEKYAGKFMVEVSVDLKSENNPILGEIQEQQAGISSTLAKRFNVTKQTIRNAIRYRTNSTMAQEIRLAAAELEKENEIELINNIV